MPHRQLVDPHGRHWDVWQVFPERAERRRATPPAERPAVERREHDEFRVPLDSKWVNGWLCFEAEGEKRRLAPFPEDWHTLDDEQLLELLAQADLAPPPRRQHE